MSVVDVVVFIILRFLCVTAFRHPHSLRHEHISFPQNLANIYNWTGQDICTTSVTEIPNAIQLNGASHSRLYRPCQEKQDVALRLVVHRVIDVNDAQISSLVK